MTYFCYLINDCDHTDFKQMYDVYLSNSLHDKIEKSMTIEIQVTVVCIDMRPINASRKSLDRKLMST